MCSTLLLDLSLILTPHCVGRQLQPQEEPDDALYGMHTSFSVASWLQHLHVSPNATLHCITRCVVRMFLKGKQQNPQDSATVLPNFDGKLCELKFETPQSQVQITLSFFTACCHTFWNHAADEETILHYAPFTIT